MNRVSLMVCDVATCGCFLAIQIQSCVHSNVTIATTCYTTVLIPVAMSRFRYNPMSDQWCQRSSMNVPRNRVGVGVIDNMIYAVGGSQGPVHHSSTERWASSGRRRHGSDHV